MEGRLEKIGGVWMVSFGNVAAEIDPQDPKYRDEIARRERWEKEEKDELQEIANVLRGMRRPKVRG
ncbi:MAG: hypothetical protein Q8P07_04870 [bacterium]|nr:hypothetical protein [bacterium]